MFAIDYLCLALALVCGCHSYSLNFYEGRRCASENEGTVKVLGPSSICYTALVDGKDQYPQSVFVTSDSMNDETYEIVFFSDNVCRNVFSTTDISACLTTADVTDDTRIRSYKIVQSRQPSIRRRRHNLITPEEISAETMGITLDEYMAHPSSGKPNQLVMRGGVEHIYKAYRPNAYLMIELSRWLSGNFSLSDFYLKDDGHLSNHTKSLDSLPTNFVGTNFLETCQAAGKCFSRQVFGDYISSAHIIPLWLQNAPAQGTWKFLNAPLVISTGAGILSGYTIGNLVPKSCDSKLNERDAIIEGLQQTVNNQPTHLQAIAAILTDVLGNMGTIALTYDSTTQQAANDCGVHEKHI